jgi:DNA-binding transcriptional MerR regulator
MSGLTIGKFAAAEGVGVETVRFYHRRGLLALPDRQGSGYREYSEADRWRLAFIRRARRLGFTLGEIRDLLGPAEARAADEIVRAAEAKLKAIEGQIAALMREFADFLESVGSASEGEGGGPPGPPPSARRSYNAQPTL